MRDASKKRIESFSPPSPLPSPLLLLMHLKRELKVSFIPDLGILRYQMHLKRELKVDTPILTPLLRYIMMHLKRELKDLIYVSYRHRFCMEMHLKRELKEHLGGAYMNGFKPYPMHLKRELKDTYAGSALYIHGDPDASKKRIERGISTRHTYR